MLVSPSISRLNHSNVLVQVHRFPQQGYVLFFRHIQGL